MARAFHGFLPIGGVAAGLSGKAVALLPLAAAVFAVAALVAFLCASSSLHWKSTKPEKKGRLPTACPPRPPRAATAMDPETMEGNGKLVLSLSSIGIRALRVAKTMSWKKRINRSQEEEEEEEEEEEVENVVWKKRILMGGKCQPLNFSGRIEYDCRSGKQVKGFPADDESPA